MMCTHQQEAMWFVHQLDPSTRVYHIAGALRLRGDLDIGALSRALHGLVVRQEALRTRFVDQGGLPRQMIDPPPESYQVPVVEVSAGDFEAWAAREAHRRLDLATGPLFRATMARIADDDHALVLVFHHIIGDGWSGRVLAAELAQLYATEIGTGRAELADLDLQPADHAAWQRAWLTGPEAERQLDYWRETLAGLPTVDLPTDRPRPAQPTGSGATIWRELPRDLAAAARDYARAHHLSFLAVLQAALLAVLHRYTGLRDLPIGSIFAGRTRAEIEPLIGYFANPLVLRTDISGDPSFAELVRRCHDTVRGAAAHQEVPFSLIVESLQPERAAGRNPLFQISLTRRPARAGGRNGRLRLGDVTAELVYIASAHARFDIAIDVIDAPDGRLDVATEYSTELFDAGRIQRLLDHYVTALTIGLAAPGTALSQVCHALTTSVPGPVSTAGNGAAGTTAGSALDDEIAELQRRVAERADMERLLAERRAEMELLLAEKRAARAQRAGSRRITPVPREGSLACTYQQQGLWFAHQLDPVSSVYHVAFALRLRGELDVPALGRALHALVVRHEALRTRFVAEGGIPRQVIDPAPPVPPLAVTDLAGAEVQQWVNGEIARPFDLATGPLFRAPLARLAPDDHVLVLIAHHIVADGWSARILAAELSRLYAAGTGGGPARLPELTVQPADHAAWQRSCLDGTELERQLGYWRDTLAGLPTVDFPTDRPRPARPTGAGAMASKRLPDDLAAAARHYARANRVSLLALSQAALLTVLHRYTGQHDLPIGSIFSGRTRAEIEPMVGSFINALVLRTSLAGNPSFAELVHRCHDTVLNATAHQDVPFGLVVDALRPERIDGRNPLFQINLSLQPPGAAVGGLELKGISVEPVAASDGKAPFDAALGVVDFPDGRLGVGVEYSTELFDSDRMYRLLDHFTAALAGGIANPDVAAVDIEVLASSEREQLLRAWNDTAAHYPPELLPELVESVAARAPDTVAVVDADGTRHSYHQLDRAANQLAHRLRRHGAGPGTLVGVCLRRSADLITSLLASWKAGSGYVPLDPDLPPDRLAVMLADAAPAVVVTDTEHAYHFPAAIAVDAERAVLASEPTNAPRSGATMDDIAYVLYTSGSTGAPKGVTTSHRAIHNRIAWMQDSYRLDPADRILHKTPYSFDVSIWECFWPLVTGATLVLAAPGGHRDPGYLYQRIIDEGVTTMHFVPTMLQAFLGSVPGGGPQGSLRRVFCSGEALPADTVRRFLAAWPDIELHNLYGPTEASIDVTAWRCDPRATTVPIGRPIANMRIYVLDRHLRPAPIGVPGQLFIAGVGLAQGYLNRPALTAERFLPDAYGQAPGQRMYATGDLARWRSDGALEYLGRVDRQVKLHGQRVELGEIEHALTQRPDIRQCAVVLRDRDRLTAYLVTSAEPEIPGDAELREYLTDRLPTYMIPTALVRLPELPLTLSGKLDTGRLPAPDPPAVEYSVPRTDTEQWLATTWQDLLGQELVGTGDNFFDLGGNSLRVTQLIARIRDELDIRLHPRHVFTTPVLAQLAARLDEMPRGDAGDDTGGIVPLQPAGTRPPLFFIHPVGGSVTHYIQLAHSLGGDRPFYAIEDPGLQGVAPTGSLAERASRYIELVRRVQPAGPYHLGGWSLGGNIGLEMARQLTDAGDQVAIVIALDSTLPSAGHTPDDVEVLAAFVIDVAGGANAPLPDVDLDALSGLGRDALEDLALDVLGRAGLAPREVRQEMRLRMRAFTTNIRQYAAHRPREYDGRLVLIGAREGDASDHLAAWKALSPAVEHRAVPGDHFTMLRPPHLAALAATLAECLNQTEPAA